MLSYNAKPRVKKSCNMKFRIYSLLFLLLFSGMTTLQSQTDYPTLEIGETTPDFSLPGIDGKIYTLEDFKSDILVIIFTCNHCPTAQTYEDRIIKLVDTYSQRGVDFVAISPNDPQSVRLDELGYTDLGDELEDMKIRAEYKGFNFPYLYDGETQETSKKYGPVATPHVFIFDKDRKLRYVGRVDDSEDGITPETKYDTRDAIEAMLAWKTPETQKTKTFGCSIKWSDKHESVKKYYEKIYHEEVNLESIGLDEIKRLIKNDSENLRLINIWATWCGPCITEFPELAEINFMYRHRSFELITISADNPGKDEEVLKFLRNHHASCRNYLFNNNDKYALIEAVDPNWQGAMPYSLLVKPGGELLYAAQGTIDPLEMKRKIVRVLGRYKDW
jgi:thiol-disulfide isomerase/thioredoxin